MWSSCQQVVTETAGMQSKDLIHTVSISSIATLMCIHSENVPHTHQPVLSHHHQLYLSDTKSRDMQAINDQKAEKGKVCLFFWDTFHYIMPLAKGGNLWLQKEKQRKKQDSSRGQQSPCLSLADPRNKVCHYHNHSHLWMAEDKILPVKIVFSHIKKWNLKHATV